MNSDKTNTTGKSECSILGAGWERALRMAFLSALLVAVAKPARTQTQTVLYSFTGGADGDVVVAGLVQDAQGNLYGTTQSGGTYGAGTVFLVSLTGGARVLYSFTGAADGGSPYAGLVQDKDKGYLYGTTYGGGKYDWGTVFRVSPTTGAEKTLYSFTGGADGGDPVALVRDAKGYLYGTTAYFGAYGWGTVFTLSPGGAERVLYSFTGGMDGATPWGGLAQDTQGNLYGTTLGGGAGGYGTVFMLSPAGAKTVLHSFPGVPDGSDPRGDLVRDTQGNLYGTTVYGGPYSNGTVFLVTPSGGEKILHNFTGGADGAWPYAGLTRDAQGNLYGTTLYGGTYNSGTVFMVKASGTEKVLYSFTGGADGSRPWGGVVRDEQGNLYGTTFEGGAYGHGTVFKLAR